MTTDTAPALTPASVAAMSNHELNTVLAEMLGWTRIGAFNWRRPQDTQSIFFNPPAYCTDPAAAADAVATIEAQGCDWALDSTLYAGSDGELYRVYRMRIFEPKPRLSKDGLFAETEYKPTAQRAVAECAVLALAAMQEKQEK